MALPLNIFQTVTAVVPTSATEIYTAPTGYTGVILLAQVTNIGTTSHDITVLHRRGVTDTEILKEYPISGKDTSSIFTGKLVLENGDKLVIFGSDSSNLKFIASILETLN